MPLSQRKTELALQWHRKHYQPEYIAQLPNTNNKLNPRKHKIHI